MIVEPDGSMVILEAEWDFTAVDTGFKTGIFRMPPDGLQTNDTRPEAVSTHLAAFGEKWPMQIHRTSDGDLIMASESGVFKFAPDFTQDMAFGVSGRGQTTLDRITEAGALQADDSMVVAGVVDGHAALQRVTSNVEPGEFIIDDNSTLRVRGTDEDDEINVLASSVRINGAEQEFDPTTIRSIEIDAGDGDDVITVASNDEPAYVLGGSGDDRIAGGNAGNTLSGGGGNDTIDGGDGRDVINGGPGDDKIGGGWGRDIVRGGAGRDYLDGGSQNDILRGDGGNDVLFGRNGDDQLDGGPGDDRLNGGNGDDSLFGGRGDDRLIDARGEINHLTGSFGHDTAYARPIDIIASVEDVLT
jgi:Ca2+-binding RTX toxin-like protein